MFLTFFFHTFLLVFSLFFFLSCSDENTNSDFFIKVVLQDEFFVCFRKDFACL